MPKKKSSKTKTTVVVQPPKYPKVVETWGEPSFTWNTFWTEMPTDAINGNIKIERYRVTVEKIEEPIEVLRARLLKLWRTDEHNPHHYEAFQHWAEKLGMDFQKEFKWDDHGVEHPKGRRY